MEYFLSVVIGIISSLIATALFIATTEFIKRRALPWYADKIYRGVRVDGKWLHIKEAGNEDLKKVYSWFELNQSGDKIHGIFGHAIESNENSETTTYSVEGILRDTYFIATMQPTSKTMIDALACNFRIYHSESKLRMKGTVAYTDTKTGEVNASQGIVYYLENS